jgi:hypothetical protein
MINEIESRFYKVAGHLFSVTASPDIAETLFAESMDNYEPFAEKASAEKALDESVLFSLKVDCCDFTPEYTEELCQDDEGQQIICGLTAEKCSVFDFRLMHEPVGSLLCALDYKTATLYIPKNFKKSSLKYAVNNALMVMYAIATAPYGTMLFHAAVTTYQGHGYLFLGKSGTGKSTHARLWLKHVDGTSLLNDDNPVVRVFEDAPGAFRAVVYGSPWSGKTPCYKNEEYPLGGAVLLSQAPFNKITRLRGVQAYAAIVPCISGKRWERRIADGLHASENAMAKNIPAWYLECLPDEAAAKLCCSTVTGALRG